MVKYGHQRNYILQDLTGFEIEISMKASKTPNRFKTGFQQPKTVFQTHGNNIPCFNTVKPKTFQSMR